MILVNKQLKANKEYKMHREMFQDYIIRILVVNGVRLGIFQLR